MKINNIKLGVLLVRHNWNYMDLVRESKVSKATISSIKNGKSCSFLTVVKIADTLGVEVTEILED